MKKIFYKLTFTILFIFSTFYMIDNVISPKKADKIHPDQVTITVIDEKSNVIAEETVVTTRRYLGQIIDDYNDGTHDGLSFGLGGHTLGRTVLEINGLNTSWTHDYFSITSSTNVLCKGYTDVDFSGGENYCQMGIDGLEISEYAEEFTFTKVLLDI